MQKHGLAWREKGGRIGFVPTMGFLHEGHLSLVAQARRRVGPDGLVVLSIYVNPTQFAPHEDFEKYPRDFASDSRMCRKAGVDILFAPSDTDMYPGRDTGDFSTYVNEEKLSQYMEGRTRPTHFRGVTTVVAKLFNIVQPTVAVFGAKDWQQAAIIRRMVRDLNFPIRIEVSPTFRETDGLAMSSRNKYLDPDQRQDAVVLSLALRSAEDEVKAAAAGVPALRLKNHVARLISAIPGARLDYAEFFDPEKLTPVTLVTPGAHMALAVYIGKTRLIDNAQL